MRNIFGRKKTDNTPFNEKREKSALVDFLQSVTLAIIFSIIIFSIVTPSEVEGSSMEPNFHNGERVYTNRLPQWFSDGDVGRALNLSYNRGDVIVFYKPGMGGSLIKRIIGIPGDKIELLNGQFYVNGKRLLEEYLASDLYTKSGTFLSEGEVVQVPENSYFVAGDNRAVSNDSRFIGFIDKEWMQGKVIFRLWPLDKIGIIHAGEYKLENP
ncbi:signal peptidase I [Candidatus Brocadiaceae bacterium]|nr:signal peptidase I [Candidatus Dojkabacteria bacterium]CAG0943151.1 signal peptidase I [Candidatus Brocadiaceae bacterium]